MEAAIICIFAHDHKIICVLQVIGARTAKGYGEAAISYYFINNRTITCVLQAIGARNARGDK